MPGAQNYQMSQKANIIWPMLLAVVMLGALAFVAGRPRLLGPNEAVAVRESEPLQVSSIGQVKLKPRNLTLQPAAFEMARRLGQRFSPTKRETSFLAGALITGSERRVVEMTRQQTDSGEQVEIKTVGAARSLTWDAAEGPRSSGTRVTSGDDRELIERLVLDSPDQFVLAQLRGASYSTIARNVQSAGATDGSPGPLWDAKNNLAPTELSTTNSSTTVADNCRRSA